MADEPSVIAPHQIAHGVLSEPGRAARKSEPHPLIQRLAGSVVIDQRAVRQMDVEQLVRSVEAGLQFHTGKLRLGVGLQQQIHVLRGQRHTAGVGPEEDAGWLVAPATEERNALISEGAACVCADGAAHDLSAVDALEREETAADVVEHLDGVPVQRIDLVARLEQRNHGIRVDLAGAVLERVHLRRIGQFHDHKEPTVSGHEVAVYPHDIEHRAEIGIGDLDETEGGRPVVQPATGCDGQAVERVVERDIARPAHIAQHGNGACAADGDEACAHDPVAHTLPFNTTTVRPGRSGGERHDAISRAQVLLAHAGALGYRHHVHRERGADVRPVVRVDAGDDGNGW
ncbi:MAG: hypothetical protein AN487_22145, partial [Anabaena sp. CRKS33]